MIIKAEGISRRFLRKTGEANFFFAVKETDFELTPGKLTEITGRSGSGKSTFLSMLSGLLEPTAGKVTADGTDLYAMEDRERSRFRNRNIGVIPQGHAAVGSLTVMENVLLPAGMYIQDRAEMVKWKNKAEKLLRRVGIEKLRDAWPNELSGGELRRLSIARALMMSPGVIMADEPTGDLDDENTAAVLRLLKNCAEQGAAVLLVTHEQMAEKFADTIYVMRDGVLTYGERLPQ